MNAAVASSVAMKASTAAADDRIGPDPRPMSTRGLGATCIRAAGRPKLTPSATSGMDGISRTFPGGVFGPAVAARGRRVLRRVTSMRRDADHAIRNVC
jgi:hypothetical protein